MHTRSDLSRSNSISDLAVNAENKVLIAKAHVILVVALTARVTWAASRVDRDGADVFFAFEGRRAALRSDKEQAKEPTHDQYTCLDARHILPLIVLVTSCQDI